MIKPKDINELDKSNCGKVISIVTKSILDNHGSNPYEYGIYKGKLTYNTIYDVCIEFINNGWKYVFYRICTKNKRFKKVYYVEFILSMYENVCNLIDNDYNQIDVGCKYNDENIDTIKNIRLIDLINILKVDGVIISISRYNHDSPLYSGYVIYKDKINENIRSYLNYNVTSVSFNRISDRNVIHTFADVVIEV